ncbi:amidohydrolase family protein [Niallia sp. 03133]|uniref:amidohydrolase family protein n=1 Tax=Niallia sp. 03133 TaxID=3458060 RepID=UPI0040444771
MIIDGHAHISHEPYNSVEKLMDAMVAANIDKAVLFPGGMLDVRQMTNYVIGKAKVGNVEPNNAFLLDVMKQYPEKFYGFCTINPNQKIDDALAQLTDLKNSGFVGLKMAPMVHQFSLLGKVSKGLADLCGQLKIPFYTHTLFHASASTGSLGKLAEEFKNTTFIIGHMGFGPLDVEAIKLASTMDNVFLETSSSNYLAVEQAVDKCGHEKIIFGSEFPLSDPVVERIKIDRLPISDEKKEFIFSNNILQIIQSEAGVL